MAKRILLVVQGSSILDHPSTETITTYSSGEVLVRTGAPQVEGGRQGAHQLHGLVLDGVDEPSITQAETAPRPESSEPFLAYVVLAGPTHDQWLKELRAISVEPLRFQPRSAYLAKATGPAFDKAMQLNFVVRVNPLIADFKSAPVLPENGPKQVWIAVEASFDLQAVIEAMTETQQRAKSLLDQKARPARSSAFRAKDAPLP